MSDGKALPSIVYNGNVIPSASAMEQLYQEQMPKTRYEAQSYDCHVLNPDYGLGGSPAADVRSGRTMSILLTVSGFVKYGELKSAAPRGFNETFVLVPNHDANTRSAARSRSSKDWVIQSQTFRQVSGG